MNPLISAIFLAVISVCGASLIGGHATIVGPGTHGALLKGPAQKASLLGPDGSHISAAADAGALKAKPLHGGVITAAVAPGHIGLGGWRDDRGWDGEKRWGWEGERRWDNGEWDGKWNDRGWDNGDWDGDRKWENRGWDGERRWDNRGWDNGKWDGERRWDNREWDNGKWDGERRWDNRGWDNGNWDGERRWDNRGWGAWNKGVLVAPVGVVHKRVGTLIDGPSGSIKTSGNANGAILAPVSHGWSHGHH